MLELPKHVQLACPGRYRCETCACIASLAIATRRTVDVRRHGDVRLRMGTILFLRPGTAWHSVSTRQQTRLRRAAHLSMHSDVGAACDALRMCSIHFQIGVRRHCACPNWCTFPAWITNATRSPPESHESDLRRARRKHGTCCLLPRNVDILCWHSLSAVSSRSRRRSARRNRTD